MNTEEADKTIKKLQEALAEAQTDANHLRFQLADTLNAKTDAPKSEDVK